MNAKRSTLLFDGETGGAADDRMAERPPVSLAVVRRLPRYYRCLDEMKKKGVERVSSSELAEKLGLTASQIRQDLSNFGGFGQQGYGYSVPRLRGEIRAILGLDSKHTAILLGVGNIGHALLRNFRFAESGFRLLGAFDCDMNVVGTDVNGYVVLDVASLESFCDERTPDVAILCVPGKSAHEMAERVASLGVRYIWNFTEEDISGVYQEEPGSSGLRVENIRLSDSLMTLGFYVEKDEK